MEGFIRPLRKVTKSKTVFPSDDSLFLMLYLAYILQKMDRPPSELRADPLSSEKLF